MLPPAAAIVAVALSLLAGPKIPYVFGGASLKGMDCEGFVQYCVREAGGVSKFAGSNDMFRHDVSWVGPLDQAQTEGRLVPGAALFVVVHDGKEPAEYQGDGLGNAQHVGLYTDAADAPVMSASSVTDYVGETPLSMAGWTHVGWLKDVDYSAYTEPVHPSPDATRPVQPTPTPTSSPTSAPTASPPASTGVTPAPTPTPIPTPAPTDATTPTSTPQIWSIIVSGPGSVRMHDEPSITGKYMGSIPQGKSAMVYSVKEIDDETWFLVKYKSYPLWWVLDGMYLTKIY